MSNEKENVFKKIMEMLLGAALYLVLAYCVYYFFWGTSGDFKSYASEQALGFQRGCIERSADKIRQQDLFCRCGAKIAEQEFLEFLEGQLKDKKLELLKTKFERLDDKGDGPGLFDIADIEKVLSTVADWETELNFALKTLENRTGKECLGYLQ